jgi:tetratricopeptide (TPR) repeat protein
MGKTPPERPRTTAEWFEHGRACFHRPDGVAAIEALERVVADDPRYRHPDGDNPYFYLGKIAEIEERIDEAVIYYSRALAVDPADEESRIGRGSCYTVRKEHSRAIADFSQLLRVPDRLRRVPRKHLLYAIAENYRQMADWGQALHWGKLALAADPSNERHRQLVEDVSARGGTPPRRS